MVLKVTNREKLDEEINGETVDKPDWRHTRMSHSHGDYDTRVLKARKKKQQSPKKKLGSDFDKEPDLHKAPSSGQQQVVRENVCVLQRGKTAFAQRTFSIILADYKLFHMFLR